MLRNGSAFFENATKTSPNDLFKSAYHFLFLTNSTTNNNQTLSSLSSFNCLSLIELKENNTFLSDDLSPKQQCEQMTINASFLVGLMIFFILIIFYGKGCKQEARIHP